MPGELSDMKLQLGAMQREVQHLSRGEVQADKCGLERLYSLAAHVCLRLVAHVKVCTCMYVCMCMYIHMYVCMHICVYIYIYIYIHIGMQRERRA